MPKNSDNFGSGNGFVPDGNKPLPEPMLTYLLGSSDIHMNAISQEIPQSLISKINLKLTYPRFNSNLLEDNELNLNNNWYWHSGV